MLPVIVWTKEQALAVGACFVSQHRRLPTSDDLAHDEALPRSHAVIRLFGSLGIYQRALPIPQPPAPRPRRACLRCERPFLAAHAGLFVCPKCKLDDGWLENAGGWMNGSLERRRPGWLRRGGDDVRELIDWS